MPRLEACNVFHAVSLQKPFKVPSQKLNETVVGLKRR
jgi:hypothetical protein